MQTAILPEIADLCFFHNSHQYLLTQKTATINLPSVTQIIRFISNEFYGQIDPVTLHKAADRGIRVHEAIELIDQNVWVPLDDDTAGYIKAYQRWKNELEPDIIATEWRGYHRTMLYAGTVDKVVRLPKLGEGMAIVDLKTSSTYIPLLVDIQLAGYAQMIESWPGIKIDSTWGLHLKPDGSYKFERTQNLLGMKLCFNMCYTLHNTVQKEKEA